jgi:hypothetical protein
MNYRSALRFAAVTVLTAAAAFPADWIVQEAKIPFSFRAGAATLSAGTSCVLREISCAVPMLTFLNMDAKAAAVVMAPIGVKADESLEANQARLVFECAGTECAFRELQPGRGLSGFKTVTPKLRAEYGSNNPAKPEISRVVINATKAD